MPSSADTLRVKVNPAIVAILFLLLVTTGFAQTLSVVSGDAQVTAQNNSTVNELLVIARNSAGAPMPGVKVTWTITGPGHLTPGAETTTDANGLTSVHFVGDFQWEGPGFAQSTIVASAANSSVSMHVTTSGVNSATGSEFVRAEVLSPGLGDVLSAPGPGQSAPFVDVQVTSNGSQGSLPVPNVGIRLIPDHPDVRSLACAEGTGRTAANGIAHCLVVFSGAIGGDGFSIEVGGGFRTFGPFQFAVTQAPTLTTVIRITGGNNQAALPGAALPAPLTARVENSAGQALPGVGVTWQAVVAQTVTLSNIVSTSDGNGNVSASATLGSTVGLAQVRVRTTTGAEAIFNLTVRQPAPTGGGNGQAPARFTVLGGNNQSGPVGTRLPIALSARVEDSTGHGLPNVAVIWRPSPSVSLSNTISTSDATGVVSTFATPISSTAPVLVELEATGAAPTPFGFAAITIETTFNITVGSGTNPPPTTGQGPPAGIRILSGNNQSGPVGSPLPARLTARVEDAAGNPLPNTPVTWIPSSSVQLTSPVNVSDASGVVSATATPTSSTSPIKVDLQTIGVLQTPFGPASNSTIVVTFNITIGAASPPVTGQSGGPTGYIAHIADGGGWKTAITVVNLLSVPQKVTLSFYGDSGQKWSLPVLGSSAAQQKSFDLQPNASGFLETAGSATGVLTGWATVEGSVSGSTGVGASAIFRSHTAGRQDSEAVSAMGVGAPKGVLLPFDNRNGFATGIAIANAGASGVLPITIRDDAGAVLLNENLPLGASAHLAFNLTDRYPQVNGRAGTIEIGSSAAAVLGLRFSPGGASFTSVPPIPKP